MLLEFLSWLAWGSPNISWIILVIISVFILFLLVKDSKYLLYIPLAEIFWGSLGHSFEYNIFNTRLVLFSLVVLVFLIKNIRHFNKLKILKDKTLFFTYVFLLFLILLGIINGYYNQEDFRKVFLDANAYLYIIYLPIWYQVYDSQQLKDIFDILKAAILLVAVKTLILFNIFAQDYSFLNIDSIYRWIRDTRTGEITAFKDSFFRIFMQSQFYLILAWFLLFTKQLKDFKNKHNFLLISFISAALLVSLSRSFFLGVAMGLLFVLVNIFIYQKRYIFLYVFLNLVAIGLASILIIQIFYNLPTYKNFNIFTQRSIDSSEAAASTRTQLWGPMWQTIAQRPIVGHGFGKEISYQSSDPRIKNINNPDGWHISYAFEWGWMDQLVKGGGLLLLIFIVWIIQIYQRLYAKFSEDPILSLTLGATLTSLLIIHIFTPYINHPIGLSLLMLITIIFGLYAKKTNSYH
ncbi:MAG: O-antigen ligase family protein [Patescibacteria group bacterium]